MPISRKIKIIYAAVVMLVQIYLVYAATLYVEVHSPAILWVVAAAIASALGSVYYIFVQAKKDVVGGYNEGFISKETRRIG